MGRCAGTDRVRPSSRMNTQWLLFWCRQSMPFWRATVCRSLICQSSWARRMAARSLVAVFMRHDTTGNIAARRELPRLIQILSTIRRPVSRWNDPSPGRSRWAGVGRYVEFARGESSPRRGAGQTGAVDRSLCELSGQSRLAPLTDRSRAAPTLGPRARTSQISLEQPEQVTKRIDRRA